MPKEAGKNLSGIRNKVIELNKAVIVSHNQTKALNGGINYNATIVAQTRQAEPKFLR